MISTFHRSTEERATPWNPNAIKNSKNKGRGPSSPTAKTTIAEVAQIVELGELDPEAVVTPGIFVDRLIRRKDIST